MNHTYRLVWNLAHRIWMAVAEITRGKGRNKASLVLTGLLLGTSPAWAVDETFTNTSGNWSVDANWADSSAPDSATDLHLLFNYSIVDTNSTHDLGNLTLNKLTFTTPYPGSSGIRLYADDYANDKLIFDGETPEIAFSTPLGTSLFTARIYPEVVLNTILSVTSNDTGGETILLGGISGTGGLTAPRCQDSCRVSGVG